MRARELLDRLAAMGASAQGAVPGLYAWGVTVVPVAWARGCPTSAKVAAVIAPVVLTGGIVGERSWGDRARIGALWGFVVACAAVWAAAPAGVAPLRMDGPRGLAGMLGWALFAFMFAGPALRDRAGEEAAAAGPARPRSRVAMADAAYVACGGGLAALLQTTGWAVSGAERALLVRFVDLAAGLAVIGAAADLALSRRAPRSTLPLGRGLRRAMGALVLLGLLVAAGVLLLAAD